MPCMDRSVEIDSGALVEEPATASGFEEFFHEQHEGLFGALWLVTRNAHEAEELAQDAFLRVWERWTRVSAMDDAAGYLYRTAMNLFRSRRRRAAVALRRLVGRLPPDDRLAAVEAKDAVLRALGGLTARQRAALVFTDLYGYTSQEAAQVLGIRPATVRVLAARGRAALREGMRERDE
jgi:RNA polymerase sigma factor (sigma-70 family)